MRTRLLPLAVPIAALTLAAGCGTEDTASDASTSTTPSSSASSQMSSSAPSTPSDKPSKAVDLPACGKVWSEGKRLPRGYKGCQKHGVKDHSLIIRCEIGNTLATYGTAYYAPAGGRIVKAHPSRNKDRNWKFVYNTCTG